MTEETEYIADAIRQPRRIAGPGGIPLPEGRRERKLIMDWNGSDCNWWQRLIAWLLMR